MDNRSDNYIEGEELFRLNDLTDYEVADSDPDVRGWEVISGDKKIIGKVDELIVDLAEMKVRYLDIFLDKNINGDERERHLLLPVGAASLDEKKDTVYIDSIETVTLLKIPQYEGGKVTRNYEKSVRSALRPGEVIEEVPDSKFYNSDLYDDRRFYSGRRKNLAALSEMNTNEILGTNPDVRGWDVIGANNKKIGKVHELIVDTADKKIRYIDIINNSTNKHILVPVGIAKIGREVDNIYLKAHDEIFNDYPEYKGGVINKDFENSIRKKITSEKMFKNESDDKDSYGFW
jgi:hypothetical protein